MGRLQALTALCVLGSLLSLGAGCDEKNQTPTPPAPTNRREAVMASGPAAVKTTPTASATEHKAPAAPRTLCTGAPLNRAMPEVKFGHAEAPQASPLSESISVGNGKWTWINLWAAWCAPCKEEMPRLFKWQKQLASQVTFQFVSLDDDQRQLARFLESQPADGLRASHWLPEGKSRDTFLSELRLRSSPELPVQILVNPQGQVHCIIEGAVEDADLSRVTQLVSGR